MLRLNLILHMENPDQFKPRSLLHAPLVYSAVNLFQALGLAHQLAQDAPISPEFGPFHPQKREQFLQPNLDLLRILGYLKLDPDTEKYTATPEGIALFNQAQVISETVKTYEAILGIMEETLGWREPQQHFSTRMDLRAPSHPSIGAYLPAALSAFAELKLDSGVSLTRHLAQGGSLNLERLVSQNPSPTVFRDFVSCLIQAGLLKESAEGIQATVRGQRVFKVAPNAELSISYYPVPPHLPQLLAGKEKYGLGNDVNRHGRANANASNRIIEVNVVPHILEEVFHKVPEVLDRLNTGAATFLDYGSGGAENLIRVLQNEERVKHGFGLDLSPEANRAAQANLKTEDLEAKISLNQGSIASETDLWKIRRKMSQMGLDPDQTITSVSALLHDIGPELTLQFLKAHKAVFGKAPLIMTENLRVPIEVLTAHPHYAPTDFQYWHDLSGQHLYKEKELRAMLAECAYKIISEKTHSSIPGAKPGDKRLNTAVTWVLIPT